MQSICMVIGFDISAASWPGRVKSFSRTLNQAGFDVHLVIPEPSGTVPGVYEELAVHHAPTPDGFDGQLSRGVSVLRKAERVCERHDAMLHVNQSSLAGLSTLVNRREFVVNMADLAYPSPVYSGLPVESLARKTIERLERRAVHRASRVLTNSRGMTDFLVSEWDVDPEKIVTVYNGYVKSDVDWGGLSFEKDHEIGFISSFAQKTDIKTILRVGETVDVPILMIGDGERRETLMRQARERGIDNLEFTGSKEYPVAMELLAGTKVGIAPYIDSLSTKVSCPVKLFDYAMTETAIVSNDYIDVANEFATEGAAAVVSDREAFVETVQELLADNEERERMAANAKRLVEGRYSRENQAEKVVEMYEGLFTGRGTLTP